MRGPAQELAEKDDGIFTTPLRQPKLLSDGSETIIEGNAQQENYQSSLLIEKTPTLSVGQRASVATETVVPTLDKQTKISRLAFNNMPIGAFINEVFGNQLGLSFVVQQQVQTARDLVTIRLAEQVNQVELYRIAKSTLESYGVTTSFEDNILTFSYSEEASKGATPLIVSGRTLPDVPPGNRPLFYSYKLRALSANQLRGYILPLFKQNELKIQEDPPTNSLLFTGTKARIEQAIAAAELFDKPSLSGLYSRVITPGSGSVKDLSDNLQQILSTEGFSVKQGASFGGGAVRLLPLESVGKLIIFTQYQATLDHVINWVKQLEVERQGEIELGLFSYQVQSTSAAHIVSILSNLGVASAVGVSQSSLGQNSNSRETLSSSGQPTQLPNTNQFGSSTPVSGDFGRFTVDEQLNTILFSGSGKQWLNLQPIIETLDKPAPSVMVEVMLVEVQLNDNESTGIEWLANSTLGSFGLNLSTLGGLSLGSSGFNLSLDSAGQTRALVNAFYENRKANIRSRPRLMVKSGGEASIDIGNEIPVTTSTSQSSDTVDAPIIINQTYRKTGVILDIKPTVHASGFVDIQITQSLSEAADATSGNPTILNRELSTTVTLKDGGSVLIGGLISSTTSEGVRGVPILGKIPILGKLFNTDTNSQDRTELMIMIIPYIISSPEESYELTDELQRMRIEELSF